MIRIFRGRKERSSIINSGFQRLGFAIDKQQHKWADYLNGKTEKTTHRSKLVWLLLFCLLFGGSSVFLIVRAINNKTGKLVIQKLSVPSYVISSDTTPDFISLPLLTPKEYQNIQRFKKAMDSLQSTAAGRLKYDSICKARPGLMDSVAFTEQIFIKQVKSK